MNLQGNINLLNLNKACVLSVPTKEGGMIQGVFVPVVENDIYLSRDRETGRLVGASLGVSILERREPSEKGMTHYARPSVGKNFTEAHPAEAEQLRQAYIGHFKPLSFETNQSDALAQAEPVAQVESEDDLPF